jgi:hypothetical protein
VPLSSIIWDRDVAEVYDQTYRAKFEPSVLDPTVDLLAGLAGDGPALEFAVGTGRVALPLSDRGVAVRGLELSPHVPMFEVESSLRFFGRHLSPGGG